CPLWRGRPTVWSQLRRLRSRSGPLRWSRRGSNEAVVEAREILVAVVLDDDAPALARPRERDLGPERRSQLFFHTLEIRIATRRGSSCRATAGRRRPFAAKPTRE